MLKTAVEFKLSLLCFSLLFFLLSFLSVLLAAKRTKSPGTRKVQSTFSLLTSCLLATSLGQKGVASKFFLLVFGWCGTPSVSYRLQRRLTNSQTVLPLFPKTKRNLLVFFNGAGDYLKLPLYAIFIVNFLLLWLGICSHKRGYPFNTFGAPSLSL